MALPSTPILHHTAGAFRHPDYGQHLCASGHPQNGSYGTGNGRCVGPQIEGRGLIQKQAVGCLLDAEANTHGKLRKTEKAPKTFVFSAFDGGDNRTRRG